MKPLVVAFLQSPTLLNVWAESKLWDLRVFQTPSDLMEAHLLRVKSYESGSPEVVLVCHEPQIREALGMWPRAKIYWIIHNGRSVRQDNRISGYIALTKSIADYADAWEALHRRSRTNATVITPWFEPKPRHRWVPERIWTMQSRPDSSNHPDPNRRADADILQHVLMSSPQLQRWYKLYGQRQAAGFLDAEAKEKLISECSGYLSCLRPWAGFGLAQHEMMAAGVPLVANTWLGVEDDFNAVFDTTWSITKESAVRVCQSEKFAKILSDEGLDFVAEKRSLARMNEGVSNLLDL